MEILVVNLPSSDPLPCSEELHRFFMYLPKNWKNEELEEKW